MRKAKKASRRVGGGLRAEYKRSDFGPLVRGKYARRVAEASNVIVLDPELAHAFPNDRAVRPLTRLGAGGMIDRRAVLAMVLAGGLLAAPLAAQPPAKVYTVGVVSAAAGPSPTYGPIFTGALRDRGYELGRNLVLESRFAAGKVAQLPELAADLVRRKVDLIVAFGASESLAAARVAARIPVVFVSPTPVELGLVRSLARPGGNVTGLSADAGPAVIGKLLELLKMVAVTPGIPRRRSPRVSFRAR